ncbi:uncharacterized protein LOC118195877 [Stegodyphus dumicola]|uniref:uncharacterized protein LOC118195877 n=1 Tax=Stegodyphus dumicola TaxID=202533 RepID=UPI0015AE48FF|nr:uncharacterized protein LOC118195877 [Stegodyphus dumicola]
MSKKLCTSSLRKRNCSTPCPVDPVSTSKSIENDPSFWLARLPNEVIVKIFSFLSLKELLLLRELKYERFTDLTFMIRALNFYVNRRSLPDDMSFFSSRIKLPLVREINFNYVTHVKPTDLEMCITKCPHLKNLFVIQCGLSKRNIFRIFSKCTEIENFAWDPNGFAERTSFPAKKLKKVYFTNDTDRCHDLEVMLEMINLFPSAEDIRINFSSHCLFHLHPVIGKLDIFCIKCLAEDKSIVIYFDTFREQPERDIKCVCRKILRKMEITQTGITLSESIRHLYKDNMYIHHSPWLQLRNMDCDISKFSHIPDSSIEYLIFVLHSLDPIMSEDIVENIQRVGGEKLKYFTLREIPHIPLSSDLRLGKIFPAIVSLPNIFRVCKNIVALNVCEMHIVGNFPFEALHCLKSLEILCLPSCALKLASKEDTAFEDMVRTCTSVKHFSLYGCACSKVGPQDSVLSAIQKWTKLQHLLLYKVAELRTLSFLMKVADYCNELRSLEIIDVGNPLVCHYTPSVIHVLKNSKSLTFLRINQQCFYPMYKLFWKAVGDAKNLEGLCLSTRSTASLQSTPVLDAISQLQHLHLFHIFVIGRPECLLPQVRQIMSRNGIVRPSLLPDSNTRCPVLKCPKQHVPPF